MPIRTPWACALILSALGSLPAIADVPAGTLPDAAVPPFTCAQPVPPPRIEPDPQQVADFQHTRQAYEQCVHDYIAQRNAASKAYNAIAMRHVEAANAVVSQYNAFMSKLAADHGE